MISGDSDGALAFWDMAKADVARTIRAHAGAITSIALSSDGARIATAGEDQRVKVWDLTSGRELLTLSGCETARPGGVNRGEDLGFTPVVLAAGARNVLSSLWPADDRATALMMDRFYQDLTGRYSDRRLGLRGVPMTPARALREAKSHLRALTDRAGRHPFDHPAYWAGFVLAGLPLDP